MSFINIGFGNIINTDKITAIILPDSAPAKRLIQKARERDLCIDATQGRRTRGVIITEGDQVVLSALVPETIAGRIEAQKEHGLHDEDVEGDEDGGREEHEE